MDEAAEQKLKMLLDSGKTFREASGLLQAQGLTPLQIDNAKIALDSRSESPSKPEIDISTHPELADVLLQTGVVTGKGKDTNPDETQVIFPANVHTPASRIRVTGNMYWLIIGMLVVLFGLAFVAMSISKT